MGSWYEGPRVGQRAPLFNLPTQDGKRTVALADLLGDKPVVLIFGSFT
jgi:peroxiredoxin